MRNNRLILLVLVLILLHTITISYQVFAENTANETLIQTTNNDNNVNNTQVTQSSQTPVNESQSVKETTVSAYITSDLKHIVTIKGGALHIYEISNGNIIHKQLVPVEQVGEPISISVSNDLSKILIIDKSRKGFYYHENSLYKVFDDIVTGLISPSGDYLIVTVIDKQNNGVETKVYNTTGSELEEIKRVKALTTADTSDIRNISYYWFTIDEKFLVAIIRKDQNTIVGVYAISVEDNNLAFKPVVSYTVGDVFLSSNTFTYYIAKKKTEYLVVNNAYKKITVNETSIPNDTLLTITGGDEKLLLSQLNRDVIGIVVVGKDNWVPKNFYAINITSLLAIINKAKESLDTINTLSNKELINALSKIGVNVQDIMIDKELVPTIKEIAKNSFTINDLEVLANVCANANKYEKIFEDIKNKKDKALSDVRSIIDNIEKEYSSQLEVLNNIKNLKEMLAKIGIDVSILTNNIDQLNEKLNALRQRKITLNLQDVYYISELVGMLSTIHDSIEKDLNSLNIKMKLKGYLDKINKELNKPINAIIPFLSSSIDISKYKDKLEKLQREIDSLPNTYNLTKLSKSDIEYLEEILNETISLENSILAERNSIFQFLLARDAAIIFIVGLAVFLSYKWFRRWQADKPRRELLKKLDKLLGKINNRIDELRRIAKQYSILSRIINARVYDFKRELNGIKHKVEYADTVFSAKKLYDSAVELLNSINGFERSLRELVSTCSFISAKDLSRDVFAISDKGYRENNEDYYLVEKVSDCALLLVVADGMGGHRAGEVASKEAVTELFNYIKERVQSNPLVLVERPRELVREAIKSANRHVYQLSQRNPMYKGMGTTLTLALVLGEKKIIMGHVGDSRAYLIRRTGILQLTKDHTLVQQLLDEGKITREEVKTHPERHVLIKAVGVEPDVEPDVFFVDQKVRGGIMKDDVLLLCSDGLTDVVDDREIHRLVVSLGDLRKVALLLKDKALPSNDNITIVLYRH